MPQKVQVINIENARATAQLLMGTMSMTLMYMNQNRQQRELSDSRKIREVLGDTLPKLLHMMSNMEGDLKKLTPNEACFADTSKMEKQYPPMQTEPNNNRLRFLHSVSTLVQMFDAKAKKTADIPMLGKTHNQPASPVTVGKEFKVYAQRLDYIKQVVGAGLNGSPMKTQIPLDWISGALEKLLINFIEDLGLYESRKLLYYDNEKAEVIRSVLDNEGQFECTNGSVKDLEMLLHSIEIDQDVCTAELENHYESLGEALQTILRQYQVEKAYEIVKKVTRGVKMNKADYQAMLTDLFADPKVQGKLPDAAKAYLWNLTPQTFIGEAPELAKL